MNILDFCDVFVIFCPLPPQQCHGIPRGCVEMGQDHGGLESRNQGSEEKDYVLRVGPETVGKQRSIARERERQSKIFVCRQGRR